MSFLKRIFGNYLNSHHGVYRSSHHGQKNYYGDNARNPALEGMRCPRCQASLALGERFCTQCGSNLENTPCTCGAVIAAGARFCGQCGKSL